MSTARRSSFLERLRGVGHEQQQVALFQRRAHGVHQALVERRIRLVNARRIDEHDLRFGRRDHALNGGAGGLRLVRHDRDLLPHQRVQQRRFAGVGPADDRDESRLKPYSCCHFLRLADADALHTQVVARQNLDAYAVALHHLAGPGHTAEPFGHQAADRRRLESVLGPVERFHQTGHAVEIEIAGDDVAALAVLLHVAVRARARRESRR